MIIFAARETWQSVLVFDETPDFINPFDVCEWLPARVLFARLGFIPLPPKEPRPFNRDWHLPKGPC